MGQSNNRYTPEQVREAIKQNPGLSPAALQDVLKVPEAEIMGAMAAEAAEVPLADLDSLLAFMRGWGRMMSLVRNREAVSELNFEPSTLYRQGDWLNAIDDEYNLHIRIAATRRILLLVRLNHKGTANTYSVNFVNEAGDVFWRLYARSEAGRASFKELMKKYA